MTRRIPLDDAFMNKTTDDILYGYIALNATYSPTTKELYISSSDLLSTKNNYFQDCGRSITKRTITNRVKRFIEMGYIIEQDGKLYSL